jgi:hypothetical protein
MLAILYTLFRSLYHLTKDTGEASKTAYYLRWRIRLSIFLFIFIFLGASFGWIEFHGLPNFSHPK